MDYDEEFQYNKSEENEYENDQFENSQTLSKQKNEKENENMSIQGNDEEEVQEEEEEEEEVIILDDDQKFSEDDIIEHAKFLGIDIEKDQDLIHIAEKSLKTPLPENWNSIFKKK